MKEISNGDIVYVNYPFDDVPGKIKGRPVAVLVCNKTSNSFIGMKITTKCRLYDNYSVPIDNWEEAGLLYKSYIRCNKFRRFTMDDVITQTAENGYIGTLKLDDVEIMNKTFARYADNISYIAKNLSISMSENQLKEELNNIDTIKEMEL